MKRYDLTDWLPTTKKEVKLRGWDELDVILFNGDDYVDHPSFGGAVIGRILEAEGLKVAIVPQPNWRDDLRDFKKLGRPRLFFGVSAGAMDSMVNKYTANKRLRSEDAYTAEGRIDMRPEYPTLVYTQILKELFPNTPVILGGIEASMRRLAHYDYWQDQLKRSILFDSKADLLIYGMGEKPIIDLARHFQETLQNSDQFYCTPDMTPTHLPQTVYKTQTITPIDGDISLFSFEECIKDKKKHATNFKHIEEESNKYHASRMIQQTEDSLIVVNPPYPVMTTEELDYSFDLPYTRLPHPKYKNKHIPAYEMIKFSINLHRGCFGGCAFCTISAHQGKFIVSRSPQNILKEAKQLVQHPDFKGNISDLGGPSANMYQMKGMNEEICKKCKRPSCLHPKICPNLDINHGPLLNIYQKVEQVEGVKKIFIGSGVRYDMLLHKSKDTETNKNAKEYTEQLISKHVSGRLTVAPEHTNDKVLNIMRKPSFQQFVQFNSLFNQINKKYNLNQQLIPYFISSHPGCTEENMAELAVETRKLNFHLKQVQDFTPTPMTVATECWYTGYHPYTLEPIFSAKTKDEKLAQRQFFFWYKPEERRNIIMELKKMNRQDLVDELYPFKKEQPSNKNKRHKGKKKH